jgi:hypothetical protein
MSYGALDRAMAFSDRAAASYRAMDKEESQEEAAKTVGQGMMSGVGGAAAGATIGTAAYGSAGGPWGAAIGAVVGLAAYMLS